MAQCLKVNGLNKRVIGLSLHIPLGHNSKSLMVWDIAYGKIPPCASMYLNSPDPWAMPVVDSFAYIYYPSTWIDDSGAVEPCE